MKWTKEVENRVLTALAERLPEQRLAACEVCHTTQWQVVQGFITSSVLEQPNRQRLGGGNMLPSVSLVCTYCGNTHFFNLIVLGLMDLLMPEDEPPPPAK
jgi:hypothetical protein